MATPYTTDRGGATTNTPTYNSGKASHMEGPKVSPGNDSPRGVGFNNLRDEQTEKKKKYLTAKYGQHQMMLIRKRLSVEMWIFDQLRRLYDSDVSKNNVVIIILIILKINLIYKTRLTLQLKLNNFIDCFPSWEQNQ